MTALSALLKDNIRQSGPVDVGEFMALALTHPDYGYYINRDPLGQKGDFVTAPEISQLFGEMIGAWLADLWFQLGQPDRFQLLECGPGRGTLMADILRATKAIPGFHQALELILWEASPVLRKQQEERLASYNLTWCDGLSDSVLSDEDAPLLVVANEFVDALPIRQLVCHDGDWKERVVTVNEEGAFDFTHMPYTAHYPVPVEGQEADIFEFSPQRDTFIADLCALLAKRGGAALLIDYGHGKSAAGDTLQAVKNHQFCPVFEALGEADITAHVDFEALKQVAEKEEGITALGPAEQGTFLHHLGIGLRAENLLRQAKVSQKEDVLKGLHRLTAPDQMGRLFKVVALTAGDDLKPGGF